MPSTGLPGRVPVPERRGSSLRPAAWPAGHVGGAGYPAAARVEPKSSGAAGDQGRLTDALPGGDEVRLEGPGAAQVG